MPIFEYKCETCNKTFEVLQSNSIPYTNCSQAKEDCENKGVLRKMVSSFAFSGFNEGGSSSFSDYSPSSSSPSIGCGCHGTSSCPGSSIRDKYGLD